MTDRRPNPASSDIIPSHEIEKKNMIHLVHKFI